MRFVSLSDIYLSDIMRDSTTKYAVLGLLTMGPRSGYDLKKLIEGSVAHFWSESYGQLYPILARLAAAGLVRRRTERQRARPDRHVYALTPAGRRELEGWLAAPVRTEGFRSELLLKLFLGRAAGLETTRGHVERYRQRQRELAQTYDAIRARLRADHGRHPELPYWLLTLSYGRHRAQALSRWCDETLRTLDRLRRPRAAKRPRAG